MERVQKCNNHSQIIYSENISWHFWVCELNSNSGDPWGTLHYVSYIEIQKVEPNFEGSQKFDKIFNI